MANDGSSDRTLDGSFDGTADGTSSDASASTSASIFASTFDGASDRQLLAEPSRQSLGAIVFIALRFVRSLNIFQIAIPLYLLVSGGLRAGVIALVVGLAAVWLVMAVVSWWRFTFVLDGDELKVAKGLLSLERLAIPLDRVQSVSVEEPVIHRLVGLVRVSVDTAGSSSAEFTFDALSPAKATALQRLAADVQTRTIVGVDMPPPTPGSVPNQDVASPMPGVAGSVEEVLVQRTPWELIKVGLSRWPLAGLVVIGPLLALGTDAIEALADRLGQYLPDPEVLEEGLSTVSPATIVAVVVVGLLLAMAVGWALQIVRVLLTDWDLTITRSGDGLRRDVGLFSRTSRASSLRRVQAVVRRRTPMQRWLGIQDLRLRIIGEGDLVVPGASDKDVARLRSVAFERSAYETPSLDRRVSPALIEQAVRFATAAATVATVALAALATANGALGWHWWIASPGLIIPVAGGVAWRRWHSLRWGANLGRLRRVEHVVTFSELELETIKVQMVSVRQSPFQWRRNLATVELSTPEGGFSVPMLPSGEAEGVRDLVLAGVESSQRAWM